MHRMYEWLGTVCEEFDIDKELLHAVVPQLLDLTRDVAHGPARPAAPMTAFLLGVAATRQTLAGETDAGSAGETAELARHVLAGSHHLQNLIAEGYEN